MNLTRERIRQIESRGIKRLYFEKFKEDFFLDIFLKYDVNRESFLSVLKEEETYNYLNLRYKNELNQVKNLRRPIEEILEDEELPINIRRNFEKFIYKKYITYGKERILFGRASFIDYLIKHFANEDISYDEFKEIYDIQKLNEILSQSDESIIKALARGAFLGRGSINNPKNGYHLDMIFDNVEYANIIKNELLKYNIDMKLFVDRNFVLYLKDR